MKAGRFRLTVTEEHPDTFVWRFWPGETEADYRAALDNIELLRASVARAIDEKAWAPPPVFDNPPQGGTGKPPL